VLGRVFNIYGKPQDNKGPIENVIMKPIYSQTPKATSVKTSVEVLEPVLRLLTFLHPLLKEERSALSAGQEWAKQ